MVPALSFEIRSSACELNWLYPALSAARQEKSMTSAFRRILTAVFALAFVALSSQQQAFSQALDKVTIVIFGAPSLGAFLPPVIKARKLDEANGLDINFQERTPDATRRSSIPASSRSAAARRCSRSGSPTAAASR